MVIEESDLTPQLKQVYSRAWAAWEVFSEDEGIDPLDPSVEDVVTFANVATGLTVRQRYEFCNGVVRVFKEVGMDGFSKSDAIKELRSELRSLFLGGVYAPAAVGGRSVVAHERWVQRFVVWCGTPANHIYLLMVRTWRRSWRRWPCITPRQG